MQDQLFSGLDRARQYVVGSTKSLSHSIQEYCILTDALTKDNATGTTNKKRKTEGNLGETNMKLKAFEDWKRSLSAVWNMCQYIYDEMSHLTFELWDTLDESHWLLIIKVIISFLCSVSGFDMCTCSVFGLILSSLFTRLQRGRIGSISRYGRKHCSVRLEQAQDRWC